jgi:hypothetical protein
MAITADLLAAFLSVALLPVYTIHCKQVKALDNCLQLLSEGRRRLIGGF